MIEVVTVNLDSDDEVIVLPPKKKKKVVIDLFNDETAAPPPKKLTEEEIAEKKEELQHDFDDVGEDILETSNFVNGTFTDLEYLTKRFAGNWKTTPEEVEDQFREIEIVLDTIKTNIKEYNRLIKRQEGFYKELEELGK